METGVTLFSTAKNTTVKDLNFICFGSPRCGTSMVAGAMCGLGINMGDDLPVNVEDPMFNPHVTDMSRSDFLRQIKSTIQNRRNSGAVWGWKFPRAVSYLPAIKDDLPNPRLVIVYRDPVPAVIRAGRGRKQSADFDDISYKSIDECIRTYRRNIELAREWRCPTFLVSYERASQMPETFLQELSEFCGLKMPEDTSSIIDFMKPGSYKNPLDIKI